MRFSPSSQSGPGTPDAPAINVPPVILGVIALLVAVHLAVLWGGEAALVWAYDTLALNPGRLVSPDGHGWTLLSYMLLHADWMHLLFNSLWLVIFGTPVARYLGALRFLVVCLVAGLAGGLASLALYWGEQVVIIGASGAVSGLISAAIPLMYGRRVPGGVRPLSWAELLNSPQALMFMGLWLAITLVSGGTGWTGQSFLSGSAIAWEAHLGGFLGGLLAFYVLAPRLR